MGSAVALLCLAGVIVLLRGCEHREAIRPTPQMGIESRFWIRVRLLNNVTECTFEVPAGFRIVPTDSGPEPQAGVPVLEPLPEPVKVSIAGGQLLFRETPLAGKEVVFSPEKPYVFGLNGHRYRGRLKLIVNRAGRTFDAINLVPLEPYVAGVLGEEMPYYWEAEALRAQAIAARTYCLFIKNRFGTNRNYDVSRTQSSQVYGGIGAESSPIWDAVNSTCGQVLIAPELMAEKEGAADSKIADPQLRGLFPAYYSSACGGHTSGSQEVFGDTFSPLQAVPCPYCKDVAKLALFYWPVAIFDRQTAAQRLLQKYSKLNALGQISEITASAESCYGPFSRLTRIRLTGTTGKTDTLRAEDLRLTLDPSGLKIKSAACQVVPWGDGWAFVSGRGWGHGVGMCQHGAEGMARLGSNAEAILQYYYPGAKIVNVY
ncbi:MAG: SpoIID/LytB domain-containing protein [Planctomycetes bacterium]|nr:SpoIID/LytB domain-containing protein [Planctomycetota bacterium]